MTAPVILPFCEECSEHRVKRKGGRFCSNKCKGAAYGRLKMHIPKAKAQQGRAAGVLSNRKNHIARMREEILQHCRDVVGDRTTFTLTDLATIWSRMNQRAYQRGWTAAYQSESRKRARALKKRQSLGEVDGWARREEVA